MLNVLIKLMCRLLVTMQHKAAPYAGYSSLLFSSHILTEFFSLYILAPTLRVLPVPPHTSRCTHIHSTQSLLTQAFPVNTLALHLMLIINMHHVLQVFFFFTSFSVIYYRFAITQISCQNAPFGVKAALQVCSIKHSKEKPISILVVTES